MTQQQIYQQAGFGQTAPRGSRPAVLAVDFSYGFTDTQYPTASDLSHQMAATKRIADVARSKGAPVIFSTIAYSEGELERCAWLKKSAGMAALLVGTRLVDIDSATGIQPQDPIVVKKGASSFFGTSLAATLTASGVDTLIVTGCTTSGCVRASVVDAVQSGFTVLVAEDGCGDRAKGPHDANIYDMQQKYADVTDSAELIEWLNQLPPNASGE